MSSEAITRNDLTNILNEILPSDQVDYVVEQGTSGNWTWSKWNSGTFDAFMDRTGLSWSDSTQLSTASPTWYRGTLTATIPSVIGATNVDYADLCSEGYSYFMIKGFVQSTTSSITAIYIRGGGGFSGTTNCKAYVHGTWK